MGASTLCFVCAGRQYSSPAFCCPSVGHKLWPLGAAPDLSVVQWSLDTTCPFGMGGTPVVSKYCFFRVVRGSRRMELGTATSPACVATTYCFEPAKAEKHCRCVAERPAPYFRMQLRHVGCVHPCVSPVLFVWIVPQVSRCTGLAA